MATDSKAKILLSRVHTLGEGAVIEAVQTQNLRSFQAVLTGQGAVAASVDVWVSNDGHNWLVTARFTLSGTNFATDGFCAQNPCQYVKGVLNSISGTGAAVDLTMGD